MAAAEEAEVSVHRPKASHPHVGGTEEFLQELVEWRAALSRRTTMYADENDPRIEKDERRRDISQPLVQAQRLLGQTDRWQKHSKIRNAQAEGKYKGLVSTLIPADTVIAPLVIDYDVSSLPTLPDTSPRLARISRGEPARDQGGFESNIADRYLALLDFAGILVAHVDLQGSLASGAAGQKEGGGGWELRFPERASYHAERSQFVPAAKLRVARLQGRQDTLAWAVSVEEFYQEQPLVQEAEGQHLAVIWAIPMSWTQDPFVLFGFDRNLFALDQELVLPLDLVLRRCFNEAQWRIRNQAHVEEQTILQHSAPLIRVASRLYEKETDDLLTGATSSAKAWVGRLGLQLWARRVLWLSSLGLNWNEARNEYLTRHILPRVENEAATAALLEEPFLSQMPTDTSKERFRFAAVEIWQQLRQLVLETVREKLQGGDPTRSLVIRTSQAELFSERLRQFFPLATLQLLVMVQPDAEFGPLIATQGAEYGRNIPTLRHRFLFGCMKFGRALVSDPATATLWATLADHRLKGDAIGRADRGERLPPLAPPYRGVSRHAHEEAQKNFLVHVLQSDNYLFLPALKKPVARADGTYDPLLQYTWWQRWADPNATKPPAADTTRLARSEYLVAEQEAYAAHHRLMGVVPALVEARPIRIDVSESSEEEQGAEEEEEEEEARVPSRLSPDYAVSHVRRRELFLPDETRAGTAKAYPRLSTDPATAALGFFQAEKADAVAVHGDRMKQLNSYIRHLWYQRRTGTGEKEEREGEERTPWALFVRTVHEESHLDDHYVPLSRLAMAMGELPFFRVALDLVLGTTPFQWSREKIRKGPDKEYAYKVSFSYIAGWLCNRPIDPATGLHEPVDYRNAALFTAIMKDGFTSEGADAQRIGLFDARAADLLQTAGKMPFQVRYDAIMAQVIEDDESKGGGRGRMPLDFVTIYELLLNSTKSATKRKFKSALTFIPWRNPVKDSSRFIGPASGLARSNVFESADNVLFTTVDLPSVWIRIREIMRKGKFDNLDTLATVAMTRDGQLAFASQHRLAQFELGRFYAHMFLKGVEGAGLAFKSSIFIWLSTWARESADANESERSSAHLTQGVLHAFRSFLAYGYLPSTPLFDAACVLVARDAVSPRALPRMLKALLNLAWIWGMGQTSNTMQLLRADALSLFIQWSRSPEHVRAFAQDTFLEIKTRGLRLASPVSNAEGSLEARRKLILERRGWHTTWSVAKASDETEMQQMTRAVFDQHIELPAEITAEAVLVERQTKGISVPTRDDICKGMRQDVEKRRVFHIPSLTLDTLRAVVMRDTNPAQLQQQERAQLGTLQTQLNRADECGWIGIGPPSRPNDPRPLPIAPMQLDPRYRGPEDLVEELTIRTAEEEKEWRRERENRQKRESAQRIRLKAAIAKELPEGKRDNISEVLVDQEKRPAIDLVGEASDEEEDEQAISRKRSERNEQRRKKRRVRMEVAKKLPEEGKKVIDLLDEAIEMEEGLADLVAPLEDPMVLDTALPEPPDEPVPGGAPEEEELVPRGAPAPLPELRAPILIPPIAPTVSPPVPSPPSPLQPVVTAEQEDQLRGRVRQTQDRMLALRQSARALTRAQVKAELAELFDMARAAAGLVKK
jgi:hypothetical protein